MRKIEVDRNQLDLLCKASLTNKEVATALGVSGNAVRELCIRHGVESPWKRNKRLKKESKTGIKKSSDLPEPLFEGQGIDGTTRKQSPEESAARIALQPPIRRIPVSEWKPPPAPDISGVYREKHWDVVGRNRYEDVVMSEEKIASAAEVGDVVAVQQDEELEIVLVANEKPDPMERLKGFDLARAKWKIEFVIGVDKRGFATNISLQYTELPASRSNLKKTLGIDRVMIMEEKYQLAAMNLIGESYDTEEDIRQAILKELRQMEEATDAAREKQ